MVILVTVIGEMTMKQGRAFQAIFSTYVECLLAGGARPRRCLLSLLLKRNMFTLSEAAKEVKFIYQVLLDMGAKVELPIEIHVNNVGTIFLSGNTAISGCTKHVDICYNYICKYIEDGFVKIIFVKTKDNIADLFTKNLPHELHGKHKAQIIQEKVST